MLFTNVQGFSENPKYSRDYCIKFASERDSEPETINQYRYNDGELLTNQYGFTEIGIRFWNQDNAQLSWCKRRTCRLFGRSILSN